MKVSVITVVYNNVSTISSAIESVLGQTYRNIEFIIIDGGSTDGTYEQILNYKEHIDVFVSEKDSGIYDAMNKGLSFATGDIISILNSDDIFSSRTIIEQVVMQFLDSNVDGVFGDLDYVHAQDITRVTRRWVSGDYKHGNFLWGWMPPHPTFFVRKIVYDRHGFFNTSFKTAADYELMLRLIHVNKIRIKYIPKVLVKMRAGGVSNSSVRNRFKANIEDRLAWQVNGVKPYFFTLYWKPLRKVTQFLSARRLKPEPSELDVVEDFVPAEKTSGLIQ